MKNDLMLARVLWEILMKGTGQDSLKDDVTKAAFLRNWADMLDPIEKVLPEVTEVVVPAPMGSGGRKTIPVEGVQQGDVVQFWSKYKGGRNATGAVRSVQFKKKTVAVVPTGKTRAEVVPFDKIVRVEREG